MILRSRTVTDRLRLSRSLCCALGCTPSAGPEPARAVAETPPIDPTSATTWWTCRIAFDENTVYWPTAPSRVRADRELSYGETEAGFFYAANLFSPLPSMGGTHLDAPIHFAAERWTTDQVPLERSDRSGGRHRCEREAASADSGLPA